MSIDLNIIISDGSLTDTRSVRRWRKIRRASHSNFNGKDVKKFEPFQTKTSVEVALRMMAKPDKWERHLDTYVRNLRILMSPIAC